MTKEELCQIYNKDKFHIEFVDKIGDIVPDNLMDLYLNVLELSLKAPFKGEFAEFKSSYYLTLELLVSCLGFSINKNGELIYRNV